MAGVAVAIAVIAAAFFFRHQDGYRTIQVYEVDGEVEVDRPGFGITLPYANMMLENGDKSATMEDGWLYLIMDSDKYQLAEPATRFTLEASGTSLNSLTRLTLEQGALVTHLTKPLSEQSSYEVHTPNSVMAVRGTSFRVEVWYDEKGVSHTKLQVFEGVIKVHLLYPDGRLSEEGRLVYAGQTVTIWGDSTTSDYDHVSDKIDYLELKIPTLEFLKIGINEGYDEYNVTVPDVDDFILLKQSYFDVKFTYNGKLFGMQSVQYDHLASKPTMQPTENGSWNFDFKTPIHGDTEVKWQEEATQEESAQGEGTQGEGSQEEGPQADGAQDEGAQGEGSQEEGA